MAHSYEEIRSAALDVLSGRVTTTYLLDNYSGFKIGVATALQKRAGLPPANFSFPAANTALDYQDSETTREVFWDLFRQGLVTLGLNESNAEYPFFKVTSWGKRVAEGENGYFVHDVSGYEERIRKEIPAISEITLIYLKEALQTFRSGCTMAATVMLGVATEHTFLLLLDTIEANSKYQTTFAGVSKERGILRKLEKFRKILDQESKNLPRDINEDLGNHFLSIFTIIRAYRNESGHPTGKIIEREEAYTLLLIFPHYCKKMYALMAHYSV